MGCSGHAWGRDVHPAGGQRGDAGVRRGLPTPPVPPAARPPDDKAALGRVGAGRQQQGPAARPRDAPPHVWPLAAVPGVLLGPTRLSGREGVSRRATHSSVGRTFWKGYPLGLLSPSFPPVGLLAPRCWDTQSCVDIALGPAWPLRAQGCHRPSQRGEGLPLRDAGRPGSAPTVVFACLCGWSGRR